MTENIKYIEVQKFNQIWLKVLFIGLGILYPLILLVPMIFESIGNTNFDFLSTEKFIAFIISLLASGSLFYLGFYANLRTEVRQDGIYFKFHPFHWNWKIIFYNEINKYYERKYSPIGEYGGWGIRYGILKKGMAYNVYGNLGIQFELTNGKKILIGTQNPTEFMSAINIYFKQSN